MTPQEAMEVAERAYAHEHSEVPGPELIAAAYELARIARRAERASLRSGLAPQWATGSMILYGEIVSPDPGRMTS